MALRFVAFILLGLASCLFLAEYYVLGTVVAMLMVWVFTEIMIRSAEEYHFE
jgi:hypothetical protein